MAHDAVLTKPPDTRPRTKTRIGMRVYAGVWLIPAVVATAIATGLALRGWS